MTGLKMTGLKMIGRRVIGGRSGPRRPGAGPPREEIATTCLQCGRPGVDLLSLTARRVRQSCRSCGAVITTATRDRLRRAGNGPATADPLTAFMPAAMARRLRDRHSGDQLPSRPDKATLNRWYAEYDAYTAQRRKPGDPIPPKFAKVLGALGATCFEAEPAVRRLGPEDRAVTRERVGHVLAWLAGPGRESTWIAAGLTDPVDPDLAEAAALLAEGDLAGAPRRGSGRTLWAALFGVGKGPSDALTMHFTEETLVAALRAYLDEGYRPLLDVVRERLDDIASGLEGAPQPGEVPVDEAPLDAVPFDDG